MTMPSIRSGIGVSLAFILTLAVMTAPALAQATGIPALNINEGENGSTYSLSLQILALMTALTLLPSLVLGMTSFTRIIIVLSILRQAMGGRRRQPGSGGDRLTLLSGSITTEQRCGVAYLDGQLPAETALAQGTETLPCPEHEGQ